MKKVIIYTDVRIAKQRRSHAVCIDNAQDHVWFNSVVEAMVWCWDHGYECTTFSDDEGSVAVTITGKGDPVQ